MEQPPLFKCPVDKGADTAQKQPNERSAGQMASANGSSTSEGLSKLNELERRLCQGQSDSEDMANQGGKDDSTDSSQYENIFENEDFNAENGLIDAETDTASKKPHICRPFEIEWTVQKSLKVLGLAQLERVLDNFILDPENQSLTNVEFVKQVLTSFAKEKWYVSYTDRLRKAAFPDSLAAEDYDANQAPYAPELMDEFFRCTWIDAGYTLLLVGGPGQGKTLLAVALGKAAVYLGYTTLFVTAREFFHKLKKTERVHGDLPRGTLYNVKLLIIDDIGHARPSHPDEAAAFFRLIDWRVAQNLGTIFTSNTQPVDWVKSIGGDLDTIKATLDRILFRSFIIKHNGTQSKRLQKFKELNRELRKRGKLP